MEFEGVGRREVCDGRSGWVKLSFEWLLFVLWCVYGRIYALEGFCAYMRGLLARLCVHALVHFDDTHFTHFTGDTHLGQECRLL